MPTDSLPIQLDTSFIPPSICTQLVTSDSSDSACMLTLCILLISVLLPLLYHMITVIWQTNLAALCTTNCKAEQGWWRSISRNGKLRESSSMSFNRLAYFTLDWVQLHSSHHTVCLRCSQTSTEQHLTYNSHMVLHSSRSHTVKYFKIMSSIISQM